MPLGTVPTIDRTHHKGEDVVFPYEVEADYASTIAGMTFLETIKDKDVAPTFTVTINGAITDAANRLFECVLTSAASQTIPIGIHLHDLWRTNAGFNHILGKGGFTVLINRRYQ